MVPRIALIGCGAIAESFYLPALRRHPPIMAELALVDIETGRARNLAETFGSNKVVSDYRAIVDKVDGAIIALPIDLHHPVAMDILSRRIPVLCEKPLAETEAKAAEMVCQAQKSEVALATNYGQRLWPQFAKIKELMDNRPLGEPLNIKYYVGEVFNWPTVSGFYFNSPVSTRGVLRDRGAHVLDQICWWLGGIPNILESRNDSFGGSDTVARVRFEHDQCDGEILLSWLSNFPCEVIVQFERGTVIGEVYYPQSILVQTTSGEKRRIGLKAQTYAKLGYKIVDNFIDVIRYHEKPLIAGSEILNSIRMVDECYEKAIHFDEPWYDGLKVQNG
jgi:predicted dehydrogenase